MAYIDYYKILGISKTASQEDVKKAYRKLARKYHPDLNPNDKEAEKRFKEINEAYSTLSDEDKKNVTDIVVLHNYDYDGYLTLERLKVFMALKK